METDTTTEADVASTNNEGEGEAETVTVSKAEYDKLNQTLGSLKKQVKDYKKSSDEKPVEKETPKETKSDDALLQRLEKMALRQAGVTHPDDIELAQKTAKKWGVDVDEVLMDEDFKVKLERQQTERSNIEATSKVKGSNSGGAQAKNTPEYWLAKGQPPTPADVPDSATRRKIVREFMKKAQGNGKMEFYNS